MNFSILQLKSVVGEPESLKFNTEGLTVELNAAKGLLYMLPGD